MADLFPPPKIQFFDLNGNPLVGGKLYTFAAGTSTPLATYTNSSGSTPNTNPIILDARGEANIWIGSSSYLMTLKDANDTQIWSIDNVQNISALVTLAASSGSSLIGYTQGGAGSITRTVQGRLRDLTTVLDFGAIGDGVTNCTSAFSNYLTYCKANNTPFQIPEGNYLLTAGSINFIASGLTIRGIGKPKLTFTGAGQAFLLDGKAIGGAGANYGGMTIENLIIIGNSLTTVCWHSSGLVRSVVRNVECRNATLYAFNILFSVSTHFDCIKYSGNEGGVQPTKPSYGVHIGKDGVGFYTANCTFTDMIAEDTTSGIGLYIESGNGNIFNGGTSEGCTKGIVLGSDAKRNTFNGYWMEANSISDAETDGVATAFNNCNFSSASSSLNLQIALGQQTTVIGGYLRAAQLGAGSLDTSFIDVGFDQNLSGTLGIQGTGTYKTFGCVKIDNTGIEVGQMNDSFGPVSGIKFAATQVPSADVNTLDDYEEGTWTTAFTCGTSGTITIDPSFNTGSYVKIGRQVTVTGLFRASAISSPVGDLNLTGLPFTPNAGASGKSAAAIAAYGFLSTATTSIIGIISSGVSQINVLKFTAGNVGNLAADVQIGTSFYITATYLV